MIRAIGTMDGRRTLMFLLEPENLERMQAGEPILVDVTATMDPAIDLQVLIGFDGPGVRSQLIEKAVADGATITNIPRGPKGHM